jgi:hypothetical protein
MNIFGGGMAGGLNPLFIKSQFLLSSIPDYVAPSLLASQSFIHQVSIPSLRPHDGV